MLPSSKRVPCETEVADDACLADVATPRTSGVGRHTSVIRRAPPPWRRGESSLTQPITCSAKQSGPWIENDVYRHIVQQLDEAPLVEEGLHENVAL
jgi:hypothetical protein